MNRVIPLTLCWLVLATVAWGQQGAQKMDNSLKIDDATVKELGLVFDPMEVRIRGLKKTYTFIWISDLHVIADDISEGAPKDMKIIESRRSETFKNPHSGQSPLWMWERLPDFLNRSGADAVLFGGDICDFGSLANLRELQKGFAKLTVPFMFNRADHDFSPWWLAKNQHQEVGKLMAEIGGDEPIQVLELEELTIVGFNRSTSNLSAKGLARFKEVYAKGKPIIIVSHVPFNSLADTSLGEESMRRDGQKRNLTWGVDCYYNPTPETLEFLNMACQENGLVKAVLGGHLHFRWEGKLAGDMREHVFDGAFRGVFGVITVKP